MNKKVLHHYSPLDYFAVKDHCLVMGGEKITDILEKREDVPAYIYDHSVIKQKIDDLRAILPSKMHIHYAIKANPMPEVVNYTQELVAGLDVASGKELTVALNSGMDANEISFAGPGKRAFEPYALILPRIQLTSFASGRQTPMQTKRATPWTINPARIFDQPASVNI